jgi:hypothetical protein
MLQYCPEYVHAAAAEQHVTLLAQYAAAFTVHQHATPPA